MTDKRFDYVMNEFDEIEYISDNIDCEDRDFADFIDCVNELAEENESLKDEIKFLKNKVATYKTGNALLKARLDKEREYDG